MHGPPLSALTRLRLEQVFPPALRDEAATLLETDCGYAIERQGAGEFFERIRIAAIRLSGGTREGLARAVREAAIDWRDVLMGAGFGLDATEHLRWNPSDRPAGQ